MPHCEKYDLPADMCAHCLGHTGHPDKVERTGPEFEAERPGRCGHCDESFDSGRRIVAGIVDGGRYWCIEEHTR